MSSSTIIKSQAVRRGGRTLSTFNCYDGWLIGAVILACCLGLIMLVSTSGPIAENEECQFSIISGGKLLR